MRKIKFRAWDTFNKLMCIVYHLEWIQGEMWVDVIPNSGNSKRTLMVKQNPLMQYTGLIDKNGKEIYEGDVVDTDGYIFEVGYITAVGTYITTGMFKDSSEIISNIYENPELIR